MVGDAQVGEVPGHSLGSFGVSLETLGPAGRLHFPVLTHPSLPGLSTGTAAGSAGRVTQVQMVLLVNPVSGLVGVALLLLQIRSF